MISESPMHVKLNRLLALKPVIDEIKKQLMADFTISPDPYLHKDYDPYNPPHYFVTYYSAGDIIRFAITEHYRKPEDYNIEIVFDEMFLYVTGLSEDNPDFKHNDSWVYVDFRCPERKYYTVAEGVSFIAAKLRSIVAKHFSQKE